MKQTREILSQNIKNPKDIDLILVSHLHSDHISFYPMRVIEEHEIKLKVHSGCFDELKNRHFRSYGLANLKVETYYTQKFSVKDLVIEPFEIPHNPYFLTCGFVIYHNDKKIVIATDFRDARNVTDYFKDADFIFIEANHDLQLLRQFPNPNSRFHLPNPKTGAFLSEVITKSKKTPAAVMLGHLSNERNRPHLAIKEIKTAFKKTGIDDDLKVTAAPPYQSSEIVEL